MSAVSAAWLLVCGATWRHLHLEAGGRALVRAVCGDDPDLRTMAGILLTRAGDPSVALAADALRRADASTALVDVLASIGSPPARTALAAAVASTQAQVAAAARAALVALDRQQRPA